MTTLEGNKLIGSFIGKRIKGTWDFPDDTIPDAGIYIYDEDLQFHTSWDWQVPAYSKVARAYKEFAKKNSDAKDYFKFLDLYESTIFNNDPSAGFEILVSALQHLNTPTK